MKKNILITVLCCLSIFVISGCNSTKEENLASDTIASGSQETSVGIPPNINGIIYGDINSDGKLETVSGIELTLDTKFMITSFTDGTYMLSNVTPGSHKIFVHDPSSRFKDQTINVTFNGTTTLDITLKK